MSEENSDNHVVMFPQNCAVLTVTNSLVIIGDGDQRNIMEITRVKGVDVFQNENTGGVKLCGSGTVRSQ